MLAKLTKDIWFPPVHKAINGLLCVGGDLSPERLLYAYSQGIFPWYGENSPILWWSLEPRCILPFNKFYISKRLKRKIKNGSFHCTMNGAFALVIKACATTPRPDQDGTWILPEMQEAYTHLHALGFAHSVECWQDEQLVGGIYGVALGKIFFAESMFYNKSDASKIALCFLIERLKKQKFLLFDCQQETLLMNSMGACCITRSSFTLLLKQALEASGINPMDFSSYTGEIGFL